MRFFSYLYYRMYKAYHERNDTPVSRAFMYMTLVFFFIVGVFLIYLEKLLIIGNILSENEIYRIKHSYFFGGILILVIFLFTYVYFSRKDISYYEHRFSKCNFLNRHIKIWMLIVFPFIFFFLSIHVYIYLFGGSILGKEIIGIISGY